MQNKRSHNLRKFKDFSDAEATIVGYLDGKGKSDWHAWQVHNAWTIMV